MVVGSDLCCAAELILFSVIYEMSHFHLISIKMLQWLVTDCTAIGTGCFFIIAHVPIGYISFSCYLRSNGNISAIGCVLLHQHSGLIVYGMSHSNSHFSLRNLLGIMVSFCCRFTDVSRFCIKWISFYGTIREGLPQLMTQAALPISVVVLEDAECTCTQDNDDYDDKH